MRGDKHTATVHYLWLATSVFFSVVMMERTAVTGHPFDLFLALAFAGLAVNHAWKAFRLSL